MPLGPRDQLALECGLWGMEWKHENVRFRKIPVHSVHGFHFLRDGGGVGGGGGWGGWLRVVFENSVSLFCHF